VSAVATGVRVVSVDFRPPGAGRFDELAREPGHRALPLPGGAPADLADYLAALTRAESLGGPLAERMVLLSYCSSLSLAAAVGERLGRADRVVAVDPVLPTLRHVREAFADIAAELLDPERGAALSARLPAVTPGAAAADLDQLVGPMRAVLTDGVAEALGTESQLPGYEDVVRDMVGLYLSWLRHLAACYAATSLPLRLPVVEVATRRHDPADSAAVRPSRRVSVPGDPARVFGSAELAAELA
jgi:hypothetical protein